jgi:iron complex transport system ATP-binding protein
MQDNEILLIDGVDFSYRRKRVLNNISFSVKTGEICGFLGPNGSGKTTLLKCINRILNNEAGSIRIHDCDVAKLSRGEIAKLIAVVPQELHIVFPFTVMQIVLMGGSGRFGLSGIPGKGDYLSAMEVLEELHAERLAEQKYNELSGGEKQVVLIARALFQKTEILLLDEPISHLDFRRQYVIMELIKRITKDRNLTTLITLHDPNTAGRYCNKLIMLNEGRIFHQGSRDEIFHADALESIYEMRIKIERTGTGTEYVLPDYEQ